VSLATVGVAVPNFVLAVFLIICSRSCCRSFRRRLGLAARLGLPTITLALAPMGSSRASRARACWSHRADFTLTARAKGLAETPVIFKHALKNALIPVGDAVGSRCSPR
jgi:peptide/nickel transport system permease protein